MHWPARTLQELEWMLRSRYGNERTVMVGGAAMYPSKDIVDNAVNSKDHTTLSQQSRLRAWSTPSNHQDRLPLSRP